MPLKPRSANQLRFISIVSLLQTTPRATPRHAGWASDDSSPHLLGQLNQWKFSICFCDQYLAVSHQRTQRGGTFFSFALFC